MVKKRKLGFFINRVSEALIKKKILRARRIWNDEENAW